MAKKPAATRKPVTPNAPAPAAPPAAPSVDPAAPLATPPIDPATAPVDPSTPPAPPPPPGAPDKDRAKATGTHEVLVVTGPRNGFRRAGRQFGAEPVRIPLDELDEDELTAILEEPALASSIEVADDDDT